MKNLIFLNAARLDFDGKLDFAPLANLGALTVYPASQEAEILPRLADAQVVISKELPLGGALISQFPASVELICEAGTGYNNIDLAAARAKGITVCNIPGYSTAAVAQLAITFILSFSSSLVRQQAMLQAGDRRNFIGPLRLPHREIQNQTLGVIGAGAIGREVLRLGQAMGMKLLVYSRTPRDLGGLAARFVGLDELLRESDYVSIHCPLTPDTRHLIGRARLSLMKPSACIINTARGAIIQESDLIEALRDGTIAGAALDVQDPEPPVPDSPLYTLPNVILTPHIGWKCLESRQRLVALLAEVIAAYDRGAPISVVS